MAYQALYRKYRPKSFEDFIDQDTVKKILINSIVNNKLSHAYLFAGPRGIGKTSMAKIFAKAVNCLDFNLDVCNKCSNCIECDENSVDIIEIDAASNNGVDQIRDLKNKINIVPSNLKYKVYIIDEVHMLTNSAFNALLKTLEEPPSYIIFILATTEFYEVPETIVSRCQCFNFNRISINSLVNRLKYIADKESIKIDDETLNEIAHFSNGGLRDAIGVLDKLNSFTNGNITINDFQTINNLISRSDITDSYNYILSKDVNNILVLLDKINKNGYNFNNYIEQLMCYIRDIIVEQVKNKTKESFDDNVFIIKELNKLLEELKYSLNPYVITQVSFLNIINNISYNNSVSIDDANPISFKSENISREIMKNDSVDENIISREIKDEPKNNAKAKKKIVVNKEVEENFVNNALATANKNKKEEFLNFWNELPNYFNKKKYSKMAQLLTDTFPMVVGDEFVILTTDSRAIIDNIYNDLKSCEELINKITNDNIRIVIVSNDEFETIKTKYIDDLKKGIKYNLIEENRDLIMIERDDLISKAINMFGEDIVDVE